MTAASGPTRIRGNYLGLSPDGTAGIGNAEDAIYAGPAGGPSEPGPSEVIVGGNDHLTEGNFIVGGELGVFAEGAELLGVVGNKFGYLFDGSLADAPVKAGIRVSSEGVAARAFIAGNKLNANNSTGIESLFKGSQISGNEIVGGQFGILTKEDDGGVGNLIEGNSLVENGALESGAAILVENDANVIAGNSVSKSEGIGIEVEGEDFSHQIDSNRVVGNTVAEAGAIGILVGSNANHSQIGGDAAGEANTILGSGLAMATPEEKERFGAITINGRQTGSQRDRHQHGRGQFRRLHQADLPRRGGRTQRRHPTAGDRDRAPVECLRHRGTRGDRARLQQGERRSGRARRPPRGGHRRPWRRLESDLRKAARRDLDRRDGER